ncbi:hypothetical protein ACQPW3_37260 [Actinosynnema sp. CA-248983]
MAALREWAHHIARTHPRIMAVGVAVAHAARTDPDAARLHRTSLENWRRGCARLAERLADEGVPAPAWTAQTAADVLWALMSWEVLERLLADRGWTAERYADGLAHLLHATFVGERG